jgi:AraC-like DNA-binding protein
MIAAQYKPPAPLSAFIDCIWYWDGYVQPHARERLLPDGSSSMVFNLDPNHAAEDPDVITGARVTSFVVETRHMVTTLGVHFRPAGAFPFLGFPAHELCEQNASLDLVFGSAVRGLRDRLIEPSAPRQKFELIEKWLLSRLRNSPHRHPAVDFALRGFELSRSPRSIGSVIDQIGLSHRHFVDKFSAEVGLTPKRYTRVRRFQQVLRALGAEGNVDWADVALTCGYYDQPHFVHDFKEFTSLTPEAYLRRRTAHLNHLPVGD